MENKKIGENLINAIQDIKKIKMTSGEKTRMLENILISPTQSKQPIASPYTFFSFVSSFSKHRLIYSMSAFCLVIFLSTGAVFASGNSLPGSVLYPLKIKIVEPARGAFISSPLEKIEYESSLATKRIVEAETLAYENKLDEPKEEQLNSLLETHTDAFNKAVDKFRQSDSFDQGVDDDISTNFQATMNAHARVLEVISEDKNDGEEARDIKISKTARENAIKVRSNIKDKEEQTPEKYKKRIDNIQSIIDKTAKDIDEKTKETSSSKQRIITDTHKTLDNAKKSLLESNEDDKKGDSKNSHSKLLDSESSAKEARIFFKAGLEFKRKGI